MRKKKSPPPTELPPHLIQEGPAIGLPKDPASEVIQDKPITHTVEGRLGVGIIPGSENKLVAVQVEDPKKPVVKPWTGHKWSYEFLMASGPHPTPEYYAKFKKLGEEGWEFVGKDSYGRNVFKRSGTS